MTTEAPSQTHCPTCGAKITQTHLSLCSYCGTPLGIEGRQIKRDDATTRRLAKIPEHKDYAEAIEWSPPEGVRYQQAERQKNWAITASMAGLIFISLGWLGSDASQSAAARLVNVPAGIGIALGLVGLVLMVKARATQKDVLSMPMMKRPAMVAERRSRTLVEAGGRTTYYFDLVFEDGSGGEFSYLGRGASHDPLVAGNTGLAYTRRDELLAFKMIRV